MDPDTHRQFQEVIARASELEAQLKDMCTEIARARRDYFRGGKSEEARLHLLRLEEKAEELKSEFSSIIQFAQGLAGIPEEVLEKIELARVEGDSLESIKRRRLVTQGVPPSSLIEDELPKALDRILPLVDLHWLRKQRQLPFRLDRDFLESPLSLVRNLRIESEFPVIHRFAQAICVCEDYVAGREDLDFFAASLLIPQTAGLGTRLLFLDDVEGETTERIKSLWTHSSQQVESTVFELLVAASCAARGRSVELLPVEAEKTPDIRIHDYPFPTVVECKRKRSLSDYELEEAEQMKTLFGLLYDAARNKGLWGVFHLELYVEAKDAPKNEVVGCLIRQRLAHRPHEATAYGWGKVAFRELPRRLEGPETRLYSPAFLLGVFGWDPDLPSHDGIICKVSAPDQILVDLAEEPVGLLWSVSSPEAVKKRSWSPLDLFGEATAQVPPGEVGIIYVCYQEGAREWISDQRTENFTIRMAEWDHEASIRLPVSFLIRLYPRPLGHGAPDLIENGIRFMSQLYGNPVFFKDFPTTVFTRVE